MKTLICVAVLMVAENATIAQGTINFRHRNGLGTLAAPVYGPEPDPTIALRGNATTNGGTTVYHGDLLGCCGYYAALFGGPAGITDENSAELRFIQRLPFDSRPNFAGFVPMLGQPPPEVPGVPPGAMATFQMRTWDNRGGTILSWQEALTDPNILRGSSALFTPPDPLGGRVDNMIFGTPDLIGLTSFNLRIVPEPTLLTLFFVAGGLTVFQRWGRWMKRRK
jgi:hypothetical protein